MLTPPSSIDWTARHVIIPFLIHLGLLLTIGVDLRILLLVSAYLVACHGIGGLAIDRLVTKGPALHPSFSMRAVFATLTGAVAYAVSLGAALHFTTAPNVLIKLCQGGLGVGLGCAAYRIAAYCRAQPERSFSFSALATREQLTRNLFAASLALVLCTCTMLGFNNSPNPTLQRTPIPYDTALDAAAAINDAPQFNWGYQGDKGSHLVMLPDQLLFEGLPGKIVGHRGVQLSLLPIVIASGDYSAHRFVDAYKVAGFAVWLALLLVLGSLGRDLYGLNENQVRGLIFAGVFLAAISIPPFAWPASTYAGFVKPTLSTFHNTTQLLSLLVGGAGVLLILSGLAERPAGLPLGVFLLSSSFFYKPSTFTIVAPFFVAFGFFWARSLGLRNVVWLFSLCVIPVGWVSYLSFHGTPSPPLSPSFSPFLLYFDRAAWRFPSWITESPTLFGTVIVLCSFLFVGLVAAPFLPRIFHWKRNLESARFVIPFSIFVVGSLISLVVVERNERQAFGNFAWFGHAAYFFALPAFFWCYSQLKSPGYKMFCSAVLVLHLFAGVQHLAYFTIEGKIVGRPPSAPPATSLPPIPPSTR